MLAPQARQFMCTRIVTEDESDYSYTENVKHFKLSKLSTAFHSVLMDVQARERLSLKLKVKWSCHLMCFDLNVYCLD